MCVHERTGRAGEDGRAFAGASFVFLTGTTPYSVLWLRREFWPSRRMRCVARFFISVLFSRGCCPA